MEISEKLISIIQSVLQLNWNRIMFLVRLANCVKTSCADETDFELIDMEVHVFYSILLFYIDFEKCIKF